MRRDEDSDDRDRPKLKSLAQTARGNKLKQIRGTLIAIGVLTILLNGIQLFMIPGMARDAAAKQGMPDGAWIGMAAGFAIVGGLVLLGLLFIGFGMLVRSYPVPITIIAFVLFLPVTIICGISNVAGGGGMGIGWTIANVFCCIGLGKAIGTAFAYERERRAELAPAEGEFEEYEDE